MFGLSTSNYSGINGILLNPASIVNSREYCEVNILTAGVSFENNYLYLNRNEYTLGDLFKKEYQTVDYKMKPDKLTIYDLYNQDIKNAYLNIRVMGPSLMFSYRRHAIAVSASMRAVLSVNNLPFHVAKFSYEGVDYTPQQNIDYSAKDFDLTHISWAEIDFTYAYKLLQKNKNQLSLGITAKRLLGFTGLYIDGRSVDYMVPDDSTLVVYNIDADIGIAVPMDRDTNRIDYSNNLFRGRGWGFDIGLVYQKNKNTGNNQKRHDLPSLCGQTFEEYDYKIGITLLDFGNIYFTQQSDKWVFEDVGTYWPMVNKTNYRSIAEAAGDLGYRFYSDSLAARKDNRFRIFLPTALSVQFDWNAGAGFYINTVLMHSLRLQLPGVYRPAQLAVIPRFESRYVEAAVPLSLYNLSNPRVGFSLRLFFLTVGTDKLGAFLGMRDLTGMDAYCSLKIPFNKGHCKGKNKKKLKDSRRCGNAEYQRFLK